MSDTALMMTEPVSKKIVLKNVYGKTNNKLRLEPCYNQRTSQWMGVKKLSDEQKRNATYFVEPGVTFLIIKDGHEFDLTREKDRIDWEWVQFCPQIGVGRESTDFQFKGQEAEDFKSYEGGEREFYVYDEEAEVSREERRLSKEFEAEKYVHDQSNTGIYRVARLLGSNMENSTPSAVRNFLVSKARKHPEKVLAIALDPAQKSRLFLYAALDKEIVRKRDGVYYYNEVGMGTTEDQALLWLQEDRNHTLVRGIAVLLKPENKPTRSISEANQAVFASTMDDEPEAASVTSPVAAPTAFAPAFAPTFAPAPGFVFPDVLTANDDDEPSLDDMDALAPALQAPAVTLPRAQARRQNGSNK